MPVDVRTLLKGHKQEILATMADIAASDLPAEERRRQVERLAVDLEESERIITISGEAPKNGKSVAFQKPIDVACSFLKSRGIPDTIDGIIDGAILRGFAPNENGVRTSLSRAIKVFLNGTGAQTKRIKMLNRLVGLYEWDNRLFERK